MSRKEYMKENSLTDWFGVNKLHISGGNIDCVTDDYNKQSRRQSDPETKPWGIREEISLAR